MSHFAAHLSDTGIETDDLSVDLLETTRCLCFGGRESVELRAKFVNLPSQFDDLGRVNRRSFRCSLKQSHATSRVVLQSKREVHRHRYCHVIRGGTDSEGT